MTRTLLSAGIVLCAVASAAYGSRTNHWITMMQGSGTWWNVYGRPVDWLEAAV